MSIIKKSRHNKRWRGYGEKRTLLIYCWWECRLVQPLWRFLKKLKIELPYDPAIPLLGIYLKKKKRDFPGGGTSLLVQWLRTLYFQCVGHGFNAWLGK